MKSTEPVFLPNSVFGMLWHLDVVKEGSTKLKDLGMEDVIGKGICVDDRFPNSYHLWFAYPEMNVAKSYTWDNRSYSGSVKQAKRDKNGWFVIGTNSAKTPSEMDELLADEISFAINANTKFNDSFKEALIPIYAKYVGAKSKSVFDQYRIEPLPQDKPMKAEHRLICIHNFLFNHSAISRYSGTRNENNGALYKATDGKTNSIYVRASSTSFHVFDLDVLSNDTKTWHLDVSPGKSELEHGDDTFTVEDALSHDVINNAFPIVSSYPEDWLKDLLGIADELVSFKTRYGFHRPPEMDFDGDVLNVSYIPDNNLNRDPDLNRARNLPFISRNTNSACFSVINVSKDYLGRWADNLPKRLGVISDDYEVEGLRKPLWQGWCNCSRESRVGIGYSTSLGNIYIWSLPSANEGKFSYEICLPKALTPMINNSDLEAIVPTILGVKWEPLIELVSSSIRNKIWTSFLQ